MMKTIVMTAEQTAIYDSGDAKAAEALVSKLRDQMDAKAEGLLTQDSEGMQADSVTVELHTADGIVVDAHTYTRE